MNNKIVVMTQEDGDDKVVSVFEWKWFVPQAGATTSVVESVVDATAEVKALVANGYRPTGDDARRMAR
jgi:hypothetical protein